MYRTGEEGVWRINTTRLHRLDGTNAQDLTRERSMAANK